MPLKDRCKLLCKRSMPCSHTHSSHASKALGLSESSSIDVQPDSKVGLRTGGGSWGGSERLGLAFLGLGGSMVRESLDSSVTLTCSLSLPLMICSTQMTA